LFAPFARNLKHFATPHAGRGLTRGVRSRQRCLKHLWLPDAGFVMLIGDADPVGGLDGRQQLKELLPMAAKALRDAARPAPEVQ
jgi:hypothetical protein